MTTLLKFDHGLGDAVQLTAVLRALARRQPDRVVDVFCLRGKHSAFTGLCRRAYHNQEPRPEESEYQEVLELGWQECGRVYPGLPCTKTVRCLDEVFGITPAADELRYQVAVSADARQRATDYLRQVCQSAGLPVPDASAAEGTVPWPVLLLHYQGNTATESKNLSHRAAQRVCAWAMCAGLVPVILDWDHRSPLPDGKRIFCPGVSAQDIWGGFGSGDAEMLAALVSQAAVFVGIDSGPLHVAAATQTPTLGVWTGHHPVRYFDLADNVTHLVPSEWRKLSPAQDSEAAETFARLYRHETFAENLLPETLPAVLNRLTGKSADPLASPGLVRHGELHLHAAHPMQDLVIVRDILDNDAYHLRQLPTVRSKEEVVVDIGAHIGIFALAWRRLKNAEARIACVEACPENLPVLAANVGNQAEVIHAACTYEPHRLALLNAVGPGCVSTGGSIVVRRDQLPDQHDPQYFADQRPLSRVTLEEICERLGVDHIDVLKLDCEGSEFSILAETSMLPRIRLVVGEYHGYARWQRLRRSKFADWNYRELSRNAQDDNGTFLLINPAFSLAADQPTPASNMAHVGTSSHHMACADPDLAPIIVTGPGRSGTTWMQHALSQHAQVTIHGQEPLAREAVFQWLATLTSAGRRAKRNNGALRYAVPHYAGSPPGRVKEIVRRMYQEFLGGFGPLRARWGAKLLGLVGSSQAVQAWEDLWPDTRWIVCLRDPLVTLASQKNTFEPDRRPAEFLEQWIACARFAESHPRAVPFRIDRLQDASLAQREEAFARVLQTAGLGTDANVQAWLERCPVIHEVKPQRERSWQLTALQRQDLLARYPELEALSRSI